MGLSHSSIWPVPALQAPYTRAVESVRKDTSFSASIPKTRDFPEYVSKKEPAQNETAP
jgi:hypothetical protein